MKGLKYLIVIFLLLNNSAFSQESGKITGTVTDAKTGKPLPGASVVVKGTSLGTATGNEGNYTITAVPSGEYNLIVTMVGYKKLTRRLLIRPPIETITVNFGLEISILKLSEIVVTGTRGKRPLGEVPGSITVISEEQITNKSYAYGADELINTVPGVNILRRRGMAHSCPRISIRGLEGIYRNLTLIDGIAVTDYRYIPMENVERIEVARGPFSSLYGGGAMGGVTNLITKRRFTDGIEGKISVGFEENNTRIRNAYIAGKKGKIDFSLNVRQRNTDGYVSMFVLTKPRDIEAGDVATVVTGGEEIQDVQGKKRFIVGDKGTCVHYDYSYDIALGFDITPQSYLRLKYTNTGYKYGQRGEKSYLRNSEGEEIRSGLVEFNGTGQVATIEEHIFKGGYAESRTGFGLVPTDRASLIYDHDLGFGELKVLAGYNWGEGWRVGSKSNNSGELTFFDETDLPAEAQINIPIGKHALLIGTSLRLHNVDVEISKLDDYADRYNRSTLKEMIEGNTNVIAGFVQGEIKLMEQMSVFLGGRYDHWQGDGKYFSPGKDINYSKKTESAFSPRVAIVYNPFNSTTLKVSGGTAFRGPVSYELYRSKGWSGDKLSLSNPELTPEKVTSGEVSIDQLVGDKILLRGTYFYNEMKDLISYKSYTEAEVDAFNNENSTAFLDISELQNVGKARSSGLEFSIESQLTQNLEANINYTYINAEVLENPGDTKSVGKKLVNTSPHMVNFSINYHKDAFSSNIAGRYIDNMFSKTDNSDIVKGVPGSYDPQFVVDAVIGYRFLILKNELAANLYCNNIFNNKYYMYHKEEGRIFGISISAMLGR